MEKVLFNELGISQDILKAIEDMGFEEATAIQTQTIPLIMSGRDVIGHSQTGSGKTAAFGIPALEIVKPESNATQILILCPTRELAIQSCEEIRKLAKYKHNIKALPIYGGQPIERQIKALKQGVQIIIGTPGRVMDHMRRKTLKLKEISMVVLDEADEMLNMGFREDIEIILKDVPQERQTVLFSATMSKEILRITKEYQTDPENVKVVHKQLTVPSIEQFYYEVSHEKKLEALCRLIDRYNPRLSLIFCNTKKMVDELVTQLQSRGYSADGLHGDMKQISRNRVMEMFRKGIIDVLVATDVAARGLDVEHIEAVFNYDVPEDEEYYVHRIGRTGRMGRNGYAFTFISGRKQIYVLKDIQKYTNAKIKLSTIPSISDVEEYRTVRFLEQIKLVLEEGNLDKYTKYIERLIQEDYTSIDVAAALIKMLLIKEKSIADNGLSDDADDDFCGYVSSGDADESGSGGTYSTGNAGMARLFLNVGKLDRVQAKDIVGAIAGETGIKGQLIGTIDIFDKYTFVEVPKKYVNDVVQAMKKASIKGRKINIEPAKPKR